MSWGASCAVCPQMHLVLHVCRVRCCHAVLVPCPLLPAPNPLPPCAAWQELEQDEGAVLSGGEPAFWVSRSWMHGWKKRTGSQMASTAPTEGEGGRQRLIAL
jgi:hypothetical protein